MAGNQNLSGSGLRAN